MTPRSPIAAREADVQRAILDWLAAERIWHIRLNTGAMAGSHKGKRWFVRFGRPGMADILAVRSGRERTWNHSGDTFYDWTAIRSVTWIEVKGPNGKQSPEQKLFQKDVEHDGMKYILARSLDDVIEVLK